MYSKTDLRAYSRLFHLSRAGAIAEVWFKQQKPAQLHNQCCGAGPILTGSGYFLPEPAPAPTPAPAYIKSRLSTIQILLTTAHLPY